MDDNGWILASKRLPENQTAVLVWEPVWMNMYTAYWTGEDWHYFGGTGILRENITHWTPLPKPPRGTT